MNRESRFRPRDRWSPGWWSLLVLAGVSLTLPSCTSFSLFGYTTTGNFDTHYKTVRVPIFQNRTQGYRGVEFMLTQAVVNQIEERSPYKVVSGDADLELMGRILTVSQNPQLESAVNEKRAVALVMTVEVLLKDLRTGQILSRAPKRPGGGLLPEEVPMLQDVPPDIQPGVAMVPIQGPPPIQGMDQPRVMNNDPNAQPPGPQLPPAAPPPVPGTGGRPLGGIIVRGTDTFIPELGQSITSCEQRLINNTAVQIVNMMEKPW